MDREGGSDDSTGASSDEEVDAASEAPPQDLHISPKLFIDPGMMSDECSDDGTPEWKARILAVEPSITFEAKVFEVRSPIWRSSYVSFFPLQVRQSCN